jgi:YD repeat-containing protein
MKKLFPLVMLVPVSISVISCKSDTEKANEVLSYAMKVQESQNPGASPASDTGQLAIQHSAYTGPVKKAPTQEELIKKYQVKSVKQTYNNGWYLENYDKKGDKISEESDYSGKKTFTYEFDKNGNVTKEKKKWKDGSITTLTYKYNEEGKLISRTYTDSDGKSTETRFEYNKTLNTRSESSDTGVDREFYDNRGLRVRFESFDEKGKLVGSGEAQYDKDGLKTSENSVIWGMSTHDDYSRYNEAGQLLEMHRTGLADVFFNYEYDDKGLKISEKNTKGYTVDETKYEYTFYK